MARIIDTNRHGIRREIDHQRTKKAKTWDEHKSKMIEDIKRKKEKKKNIAQK